MQIIMNLNFTKNGTVDGIEIDSFSFGMVNSSTVGSNTGAGAGKVTFHEITVTKHVDSASSPLLLGACGTGELLPAVQLNFFHANSQAETAYLTYNLKDVLISSIQWSSGGDRPTESISFAFEVFVVEYANSRGGGASSEVIRTNGLFFYPVE